MNTDIKIDKEAMEIIGEMEKSLQTFHGFRHLWAELVANHRECGVSQVKLEGEQREAISLFLGQAYVLAKRFGMNWSACETRFSCFRCDDGNTPLYCFCCGATEVVLLTVPGSGLLCRPCYQRTYPADALQMRFESLRAQLGALEDRVRALEQSRAT